MTAATIYIYVLLTSIYSPLTEDRSRHIHTHIYLHKRPFDLILISLSLPIGVQLTRFSLACKACELNFRKMESDFLKIVGDADFQATGQMDNR